MAHRMTTQIFTRLATVLRIGYTSLKETNFLALIEFRFYCGKTGNKHVNTY